MTDHIDLKYCPFCGEKEEICYANTHKAVYCRNCLSEGPISVDETRAVAAWNKRHGEGTLLEDDNE